MTLMTSILSNDNNTGAGGPLHARDILSVLHGRQTCTYFRSGGPGRERVRPSLPDLIYSHPACVFYVYSPEWGHLGSIVIEICNKPTWISMDHLLVVSCLSFYGNISRAASTQYFVSVHHLYSAIKTL